MSMSTHIVGFKPPDEKWRAMKDVWDTCKKADISIPKEVVKFFNDEPPDSSGVSVNEKALGSAVRLYRDDMKDGIEIDISKIDPTIKILRFYNSY